MNIIDSIINAVICFTINISLGTIIVIILWKMYRNKIKRLIAKAIEELLWGSND